MASRAPTLGVTRLKTGVSPFSVLGARESTTLINSFAQKENAIYRQFWVVAQKPQAYSSINQTKKITSVVPLCLAEMVLLIYHFRLNGLGAKWGGLRSDYGRFGLGSLRLSLSFKYLNQGGCRENYSKNTGLNIASTRGGWREITVESAGAQQILLCEIAAS